MPTLSLKPSHKAVTAYYDSLADFAKLGIKHETAVRSAFQTLLETAARQFSWKVVPEYAIKRKGAAPLKADAAMLDDYGLNHGLWEAKDEHDDLDKEIKKKFAAGYPKENILFWQPDHAVLYQNGGRFHDTSLAKPEDLIHILGLFLTYAPPALADWEKAVDEFKGRVREIGESHAKLIREQQKTNPKFRAAFDEFLRLCRASLNPNLSENAVEEMLIQHLLTERIFRKIFDVGDFMQRNVIAAEIEKVITTLISKSFSRDHFTKPLDYFYVAIENAAATIHDFSEKQHFLNTVYERFFQGFCVKIADTHGIVYTPQPLVDFMVASVEHLLEKEFGTSLSEKNVHVLDPFTGTGNFIVNVMRRIRRSALPQKYATELHCNEVMLMPYYVASMNIEHAYYEATEKYEPFEGICLVDTFETAEKEQSEFEVFSEANTERVKRQRKAPIKVILANPPYNAGQLDENDNNKNRKYPEIDRRVKNTYSTDSTATLVRKLSDPYVKAIRFAADRIGDAGIVCYVNNDSFAEEKSFDGMRKHLARDFDIIYVLELGGNVRKNPDLSGTTHNVFGIQVGVSINLFIRLPGKKATDRRSAKILYHAVPRDWRREQKYDFLDKSVAIPGVKWKQLKPDAKNNWLTNKTDGEFSGFIPIGSKDAKQGGSNLPTIFRTYSLGVSTNRDGVVHDFDEKKLGKRVEHFAEDYNAELERWKRKAHPPEDPRALIKYVDDFVSYERIKWSETLKKRLVEQNEAEFSAKQIRTSSYRPYTAMRLYYGAHFVDRPANFREVFPDEKSERENRAICVSVSVERPFTTLTTNHIPNLVYCGGFGSATFCFPFYTYTSEGKERRENIPVSTLVNFQNHHGDDNITKWDIFHYAYALLHHPAYRERFAANLKRDLPRIPFAKTADDFHAFAKAGKRLADLHVNYESQKEYKLAHTENKDVPLDWRVEKMKLTADKRTLVYNDFLTLDGIPPEVFDYRLGNRSALEWVIDQYQVSTDPRNGIETDPNRDDDEQYIVRLIGQVVTVSMETVKIVKSLPDLDFA